MSRTFDSGHKPSLSSAMNWLRPAAAKVATGTPKKPRSAIIFSARVWTEDTRFLFTPGELAMTSTITRGSPQLQGPVNPICLQPHGPIATFMQWRPETVPAMIGRSTASRPMRRLTLIAVFFACTVATAARAEFPDRPIHLIVPQAAGSASDTVARVFAAALGSEIGQQVVVDDRPGGALTVGLEIVAKSAPDGYTLGMAPIGAMTMSPHLVARLPYSIERDFQPIMVAEYSQLLLAVSPKTPFMSVHELIDYAKKNPGTLLNASSSNGSPGHVAAELFKFMTGTNIVHVPYKGGAPAINDLMAGRVQVMFEALNSIAPFAK